MNVEEYYNAKTIDKQLFKELLKLNDCYNWYIITLDGDIIERFWSKSETEAIAHFRKTLSK